MATKSDAPADTTMMRIVHNALRRDLRRAQSVLAAVPPPARDKQKAVAAHLTWMMQFLRDHHRSEDEGLYPLVRARAVAAADVLDAMEQQHDAIAASITVVESSAAALTVDHSGGATRQLLRALDELEQVLLPHLRREEDEAMPVVSAVITNAEWQAIEQEHNLKPKSLFELGREGHWLIDDADDEDRATVLGLVPAITRFVLLHGFARRYRTQKEACWGAQPRPTRRVQKRACVAVSVSADIEAVWDVVRDVTRVGEWSHECVSVSWVGDATAAAPGARFRGRNRAGIFRWGRMCEIVAAEPHVLVWRTVPTAFYPDSSEWRIVVAEHEGGSTIEQSFEVIRAPKVLDLLYARLVPGHRDRTAALTDDLRRLGEVARQTTATRSPHRTSTP
jgi:hemerythrin-like domain-containing protein